MTADVTEIDRMHKLASDVEASLPRWRSRFPAATTTLDRVAELAAELKQRAKRPLTLATVGEFSVGKSLLLSVLMGDARLLPASEVPTTGNVTALRLVPATDGLPGPGEIRVGFLSRPGVDELVGYLLDEIVTMVDKNKLPYPVDILRGARPTAVAGDWGRVDEFGRRVWGMQALNERLQLILLELVRIRDAWRVGQALLPASDPGYEHPISRAVFDDAVTIGNTRAQPAAFPEDPGGFPLPANTVVGKDELVRLRPLIRRITFDVAVRPEEWGLGDILTRPGIEILDMPGLNSAGGSRDKWLAERELRRVTTLIMVLHANRPENDAASELSTFLESARASREALVNSKVVVAQRFDTLRRPEDTTGNSVEMESLLRTTKRVSAGRPENVTYVSAMAAMAVRNMPGPPDIKLVSPAELTAARRYWGAVAQADPMRADGAALRSFAADGGLDGVRRLVAEHVRTHGVAVEVAEQTAQWQRIVGHLRLLPRTSTVSQPDDAEDRLLRLGAAVKESAAGLRSCVVDLRRVDRLADPGGPGSLHDAVLALAARSVFEWDEWAVLTDQVSKGLVERPRAPGMVPEPPVDRYEPLPGDGDPGDDWDDGWGDGWGADGAGKGPSYFAGPQPIAHPVATEPTPSSTTAFCTPYETTVDRADAELVKLFRATVMAWERRALATVEPLADLLAADPTVLTLVAELTAGDPVLGERRRLMLGELASLKFVRAMAGMALRAVAPTDAVGGFPLTPDRSFWWDPEALARARVDDDTDRVRRSHAVVLRTRNTLTEALHERLDRRLGALLTDLVGRLSDTIAQIVAEAPGNREIAALRRRGDRPDGRSDDVLDRLLTQDGQGER